MKNIIIFIIGFILFSCGSKKIIIKHKQYLIHVRNGNNGTNMYFLVNGKKKILDDLITTKKVKDFYQLSDILIDDLDATSIICYFEEVRYFIKQCETKGRSLEISILTKQDSIKYKKVIDEIHNEKKYITRFLYYYYGKVKHNIFFGFSEIKQIDYCKVDYRSFIKDSTVLINKLVLKYPN